MKNRTLIFITFALGTLFLTTPGMTQTTISPANTLPEMTPAGEKLVILWTSGDREVALKMVFMYTYNAKINKWWDDITLVVWGPSARLLTEDQELQEYLEKIIDAGVTVRACKGCADQYGVSADLEEMGITVLYIGKELTDYIKEGRKILTL